MKWKLKHSTCKLRTLTLGIVAAVLTVLPASAADRIYFNYGPLSLSVSVQALEVFAAQGKVEPELAFYLNRLSPERQGQLRDFLRSRYAVDPVVIYRFAHTSVGERLLREFGDMIQIQGGRNGRYAIRGALVQAAADSGGLNAITFLRKFPTNLQFDVEQTMQFVDHISTLVKETKTLTTDLEQMNSALADSEPATNFNQLPDLRKPGPFTVSQKTIILKDSSRDRQLLVDLYLPQASPQSQVPLIVLSNGIGAKSDRFEELSQHLASHGFAIAIPDHPGSSHQRQQDYFRGLYKENFEATEFIDRPLDITFLLNELQERNQSEFNGQLNLQQVGVFGYSIGGTTALTLAGAEINFENLEKNCDSQISLVNISLLYQCRALELPRQTYQLQDSRIKAVFVFVPFGRTLFGQAGLSQVTTPIFWQAADEDIITPLVIEQSPSFSWLTVSDKYFVLTEGLPHTRILLTLMNRLVNRERDWEELKPIAQAYQNALSLAFFKVYVTEDETYRSYLQASYARSLSEDPYNLSLVRFIKTAQNAVTSLKAAN